MSFQALATPTIERRFWLQSYRRDGWLHASRQNKGIIESREYLGYDMPLSWNEIRSRAHAFANEWANESSEDAEAKSFWDDFFRVFGLTRRHVASFEEPVKNLKGSYGYIDLFWKGTLIVEHKSRGKDLGKAQTKVMDFIQSLQRVGHSEPSKDDEAIADKTPQKVPAKSDRRSFVNAIRDSHNAFRFE